MYCILCLYHSAQTVDARCFLPPRPRLLSPAFPGSQAAHHHQTTGTITARGNHHHHHQWNDRFMRISQIRYAMLRFHHQIISSRDIPRHHQHASAYIFIIIMTHQVTHIISIIYHNDTSKCRLRQGHISIYAVIAAIDIVVVTARHYPQLALATDCCSPADAACSRHYLLITTADAGCQQHCKHY